MIRTFMLAAATVAIVAPPAAAAPANPRDLLVSAAFQATDRKQAAALVDEALLRADALLRANPKDREGQLQHAMAIGYRAKLNKAPADAKTSRRLFEALVASNPRDPEYQLALGGWHLDAIAAGFLATTVLGAKKDAGLAGINQAVALGGDRAFFKGMAALMRIRLDPGDVAAARALAEQAAAAPTPTPLDRIARNEAQAVLPLLRAGDGKGAEKMARMLLPFGRVR